MNATPIKWIDLVLDDLKKHVEVVTTADSVELYANKNTILITEEKEPDQVIELAVTRKIRHVLQQESFEFEKELNAAATMIKEGPKMLEMPLSSILKPDLRSWNQEQGLTLLDIEFDKAIHKRDILNKVEVELQNCSKSQSFIADALSLSDELITNAIFNAPYVDAENSRSGICRSKDHVSMEDNKKGRFLVGSDSQRVVIGCLDPYGSLNLNNLFIRIMNCYQQGVAQNINMDGEGGAGIGSYMIYNLCSSFYAIVEKGNATMICCCLPLKMSSSKRAELPKNLHYFEC